MRVSAFVVVLLVAMLPVVALADVPGLINYQGTITDEYGVALDTTVSMTFSIYTDSTGGSLLWNETQSSIAVTSGLFNILLGRVNSILDTGSKILNAGWVSRWRAIQSLSRGSGLPAWVMRFWPQRPTRPIMHAAV
jgi:hypothetical protein